MALNIPLTDRDFELQFGTGAVVHNSQAGQTYQIRSWGESFVVLLSDAVVYVTRHPLQSLFLISMFLGIAGIWLRTQRAKSA